MMIRFTKDVEKERIEEVKKARETRDTWEYLKTFSIVEAVRTARDMGWAENKVQVKQYKVADDQVEYHVEPFENCGCSGLLKYKDFFGTPDTPPRSRL
jgi:hypothetical protein